MGGDANRWKGESTLYRTTADRSRSDKGFILARRGSATASSTGRRLPRSNKPGILQRCRRLTDILYCIRHLAALLRHMPEIGGLLRRGLLGT
jgi:hypothetical protein